MLRSRLRNVYYTLGDFYDQLSGRRDKMTPPKRMIFVGRGDYRTIGEHFLSIFKNQAGLRPESHVLDVGCGIGRMAVPLTSYLNASARYEGFDIVPEGIGWCRKNITPEYPNFHFQHANIYNRNYNPEGHLQAIDYHFPYPNDTFDFVFLTSVFTHMLPEDMEHYFVEISRVLRKGGNCLITFFLANDESIALMEQGKSTIDFKHQFPGFLTRDHDVPESAVCYPEEYVRQLFDHYQFDLQAVHYGSWCGRSGALSVQDIIIARKK